jgi:ABC-type amino acid transport substrate-binding protein
VTGFFSFFGSLNIAIPFLLDVFRIPADTFQLFLATGVINSRVGTLVAAVHTIAVGLLGSAAIAGQLRVEPRRLFRFVGLTAVITVVLLVSLRAGFASFLAIERDGRAIVYSVQPRFSPPVDETTVVTPSAVPDEALPPDDDMIGSIRRRGTLRVGLIADGIPYAFRNDRQQLVGLDVEMAQQLASDLGVGIQFVRFDQVELPVQVRRRTVDIVMTGARLTPERSAEFVTSEPYLDETLAIVAPDHTRQQFRSWEAIRSLGPVRLGVQNLPYYIGAVRSLMPDADLTVIAETTELIQPESGLAAYVLPAERGSVLTMLNPQFTVVVPEGARVLMPLAYPIAGHDPAWVRYVDTWIQLKRKDGFVDALYEQWILGHAAASRRPRWSIIRDVLGWID